MTDTTEIKRMLKEYYYEKLHANKLDNFKEMDTFLEAYNFSKVNQEEIENLNRPIIINGMESVIETLPRK